MRDERTGAGRGGHRARRRARVAGARGAALVVLVLATPARASEPLFGSLQWQAQRIEEVQFVPQADGTLLARTVSRSQFLQTYDVNHRDFPRDNMLIHTSLRFTGVSFSNSPNAVRTPEGSIRFVHPWTNLFATRIQTTAKVAITPTGSVTDSAGALLVSTRQVETQLVARVGAPRWPELTGSWRQRERDASGLAPGENSRQRMLRASFDRERGSIYAGYSDQHLERQVANPAPLDQRVASAGGSLRLSPLRMLGLNLQYDLTDTRSGFAGQRATETRNHVGGATGNWRSGSRWLADANLLWRRTESTQLLRTVQDDYELVALVTRMQSPLTRFSAGGGARTVLGLGRSGLVKYLTAIASGDGAVRHGWRANGQLSWTRNDDPLRGTYTVYIAGGSTRMGMGTRSSLDANVQLTANGDTASAGERASSAWNLRWNLTPLRSLTASIGRRSLRVGPGFLHSSAVQTTRGIDVTWRPMPSMDFTGSFTSTGLMPDDRRRIGTQTVLGHWLPRPSISLTGSYSHSSQTVTSSGTAQLSGREIVAARAQLTLTRRVAASGGYSVAEPGRTGESRQYDGLLTWSFGR